MAAKKIKPTVITCENLTKAKVKQAMQNKAGFISDNSPEVRAAVRSSIDDMLKQLRKK